MVTLEEILERTKEGEELRVWMTAGAIGPCRMVRWDAVSRVLVCRGGEGFTEDDIHHVRYEHIVAITRREEKAQDDSSQGVRDSVRRAAGYPVSLTIRPQTFAGHADGLKAWITRVEEAVAGVCAEEPRRAAMQAAVDQIMLREGEGIARLGGGTLFLEATPQQIPEAARIQAAIEALL